MKSIIISLIITMNCAIANGPMNNYTPTSIETKDELNLIYKHLNKRSKKGSECFHRAHIWSYEMYREHAINSTKVFVFFTNKYKREINGQWWFHVAPGVIFKGQNYMMDPEFLNKPVPFESWKNGVLDHAILKLSPIKIKREKEISKLKVELDTLDLNSGIALDRKETILSRIEYLINDLKKRLIYDAKLVDVTSNNWSLGKLSFKKIVKLDCVEAENYSDYDEDNEDTYCYVIRTNMYYWAPRNISQIESEAKYMNEFSKYEMLKSHKRAFKGHFSFSAQ